MPSAQAGPDAVLSNAVMDGGAPPQDEITAAQEQAMWEDIQRNLTALGMRPNGLDSTAVVVQLAFPLRMAPGLPDPSGFRVSAFSDHNSASGAVLDYNGGARTYDGHRGTDYALFPFLWNKMDGGEVQAIAAADGTIVSLANGDPSDHNCNVSSADPWNYIALVHADGRMTIYGHLRYNSLTSKGVGKKVVQGEYLGEVGSSGNSSGAHLHFEVRTGNFTNSEWTDPYAGPSSQPTSLWANQRPYMDSAINQLSIHSGPPTLTNDNPCLPSILKQADSFTTANGSATVYFYAYFRDFQSALATELKIYRPDGSLYKSWQVGPTGSAFNSAWYQAWTNSFSASDPAGTWRFEAAYNGQVYNTYFNLNAPPVIQVSSPNGGETLNQLQTYPLTWTDNLGGAVNIALYQNGALVNALGYNEPSDGEYLWTVGAAQTQGAGYKIRISSVDNPARYDESDLPFSIGAAKVISARDDQVMTKENTPLAIDVLANDQSANQVALSLTAAGTPSHGTASIENGKILYTPAPGFVGVDSFSYTVSAGPDHADATVTVQVTAQLYQAFLPHIQR